MEALYKAYKDNEKVAILLVYVNEAHPAGRPGTDPDAKGFSGIGRHRTTEDKVLAASRCMKGLKLTLPILIDGMDGPAEKAYTGRPAATAIIDLEGKIAFHSVGPAGAKPKQAEKVIQDLLAKGGFPEPPTSRPASLPTTQPAARTAGERPPALAK